jgi:glycosyltransferase involved in cell wall biosynthesis
MKRLMVIHYPFFGGPHNQALRLNAPLERCGVRTTVLLPAERGNAAERLRAAGIDVICAPLHRLRARPDPVLQARFATGFLRDVRLIRALIRDRKPDVVEVNGLVNPQAAIAGFLEAVPVVWQLLDTRAPAPLRIFLMPLVRRLSAAVMTTGLRVASLHGVLELGERLVLFFPPVDTTLFRPSDEERRAARRLLKLGKDDFVAGSVANITPQKGLEYFIAASERVRVIEASARFILLGRQMETQEGYAQEIHGAARRASVEIRDPGDDVPLLLHALDVFLLTSVPRSEGISTTVLEAMSVGLPVVSTDVGSLREVVEAGVTGLVVPPHDAQSLAEATLRLARDQNVRLEMGLEARKRAVERYDAERCAEAHRTAYEIARRYQRARAH